MVTQGIYMLPSVLFTKEHTTDVDNLVQARLAEHVQQERLQSLSTPPGFGGPHNRQLQGEILRTMLDRATKEVQVLTQAVQDFDCVERKEALV